MGFLSLTVTVILNACAGNSRDPSATAAKEILRIHEDLIASHLKNDAEAILAAEADEYLVVGRGEVRFPTRADRLEQFKSYLESIEFQEYSDLMTPIVRVSEDGTAGWLITQARIVGTQKDQDGNPIRTESIWAWIELYEKHGGSWLRVGEVSTKKPIPH
jgi:hypothetical protein